MIETEGVYILKVYANNDSVYNCAGSWGTPTTDIGVGEYDTLLEQHKHLRINVQTNWQN